MDNIPGKSKRKIFEKEFIAVAIEFAPPLVASGVLAWAVHSDPGDFHLAAIAGGTTIWLLGASVINVLKARSQDKEKINEDPHEGLFGAIHSLYGILSAVLHIPVDDDGTLRITILRVVYDNLKDNDPEFLEQLLPYVGGSGGAVGRRISIRTGIVGRAANMKQVYVATRRTSDLTSFLQEMQEGWHFSINEARNLRPDRHSWMAVPIVGKNQNVIAVVFLDSDKRDLFSPEIQTLVISGCGGIASYLREHYK